jgi:hypothetical protein
MPHLPKSHEDRKLGCNTMLSPEAIQLAALLVEQRPDAPSRSALVELLIGEDALRRNIKLEGKTDE